MSKSHRRPDASVLTADNVKAIRRQLFVLIRWELHLRSSISVFAAKQVIAWFAFSSVKTHIESGLGSANS